ncbi:GNAT family N-acetyltransferase [Chengkuizengella sediminis]|uniref:GNAT family N-acetyltransferase n=1 Tax=Chengkuizengella sediminis TaxID=1885917 RepID=UPI00138A0A57|nr:GNAT family N-acetyltransferase [Chengkuizengella sediminis]NDI35108.1 GNAT family N-acetyltransferase [Chengkuizengella sediminis]
MENINFTPFPDLSTERLKLRQLDIRDKNEIFALRSDEKVLEFQEREKLKSIDEALNFISKIKKGISNNEWVFWAITQKGDNKLVGGICLWNISKESSRADIGFELFPNYQGMGIMQEALTAVIEYGFKNMKLNSIVAFTHMNNSKSIKLLKRNNFIKDESINNSHQEVVYILKG